MDGRGYIVLFRSRRARRLYRWARAFVLLALTLSITAMVLLA